MKKICISYVFLYVILSANAALHQYAIVDIDPDSTTAWPNPNTSQGWLFTVSEEIILTHLGLFDTNDDGFLINHPVSLWNWSDSSLLTTGVINSGSVNSLDNHFRYVDVADAVLIPGQEYVVSFYSATNDDYLISFADGLEMNPVVEHINHVWGYNNVMPKDIPGEGDHYYGRFGPNFLFTIPEPATLCLLALGGLLLRKRK